MKKYILELSEEQLKLVANCLDDVSRFAMGQWEMKYTLENMLEDLPLEERMERRNEAKEYLRLAKRALLPDVPDNGGKGYNGTEFIGNTYQIFRTIMYRLAVDNNWNNVYSSPALVSGNMGGVKVYSAY